MKTYFRVKGGIICEDYYCALVNLFSQGDIGLLWPPRIFPIKTVHDAMYSVVVQEKLCSRDSRVSCVNFLGGNKSYF